MNSSGPRRIVSALHAISVGLQIACHHYALIIIAAFTVLCERAITIYTLWTGTSLQNFGMQYGEMLTEIGEHPFGSARIMTQYHSLFAFMTVLGVLLTLGAFLLVGLLGLMRDLLLRNRYHVELLVQRGSQYFWRIFRFKLPIYITLGLTGLSVTPFFLRALQQPLAELRSAIPAGVIFCAVGFLTRIFLSLGSKIIVATDAECVLPVYALILRLIRPHLLAVFIFHITMLLVASLSILVPAVLHFLYTPVPVVIVTTVFLGSFITVFAKAAAFDLYLQLDAAFERIPNLVRQPIYG